MLDQVLDAFDVTPDEDLNVMTEAQSLEGLTARALTKTADALEKHSPDIVIVQGDTTTSFVAALAAFYRKIPVAHVEAGLRTHRRYSPFPEEINRRIITSIADLHFAATPRARENLLAEGISTADVFVTGNTVIDALLTVRDRLRERRSHFPELDVVDFRRRIVLVTGHRRENFGVGIEEVCSALRRVAARNPSVEVVYPVHRNPNVVDPVHRLLGSVPNIKLIDPLPYEPFVHLMDRSFCVVTDSGGIQEEAPSLGKPVLVTRESTERPEGIDAGTAMLVGTDSAMIERELERLLHDEARYASFETAVNPYGDGQACRRIVEVLTAFRKGASTQSTLGHATLLEQAGQRIGD
jgi:UDP-N-acetylglucosamine 2-epimerase